MPCRMPSNTLRTRLLGAAAGLAVAAAPVASSAADLVEGSDWLRRWDGVKLTLSSHTGPTTDAVKAVSAKFAELTGAEVEVIDESWTDLLSKHLADAAAGGGTYDILTWPYIWTGHYVEGGIVEDLNGWFANADLADPRFDMSDIPEAVLEVYGRYRGSASPNPDGLWSVPYKFDVYLAQYRTDLYEQAGIVDADGRAKPPETWAELLDNAKVLKEKFPDIQPVVFPLAVDDPMVATFLPMIAAYGGTIPIPWYDGNLYPEFQNGPGQEAIAILQELTAYMPADILDMDYDRVNAHMAQGLAAYALNWNAYLPVLLDPGSSQVHESVAFDGTPGGPAGRFSGLGGWQMGVSSQSANKEAAFQLLEWIAGRERGVDLALAGGSVARFSVANDPKVVEAFPYYPLLMDVLKGYAARGMDRSWAELQRTIGVGLNKILLGDDAMEGFFENQLGYAATLSVIMIAVATVLALALPAAFSMSRYRTGEKDLLFWFLSIRMIPPIVGAIPLFVLAARYRLIDTYVILPVLYIILNMPFAVWMLKSFIDEIPREIDESAMLDGCGNLAVIRRMILPLIKPGLVATAVFCFILAWNEFLLANIFTRRVAVTLPVGISKFITEKQILWGYITAAATLATLPPVVLLWFFQRNLLRGLTFGAVR